jgi:hypothetical protein
MKYRIILITLLWAMAAPLLAASVPKKEITADAKWLLHLDLKELRASKIGDFLYKKFFEEKFEKQIKAGILMSGFNIDLDFQKIKSVTAYGTDYNMEDPKGVLLIHTGQNIKGIIESIVQQQEEMEKKDQEKKGEDGKLGGGEKAMVKQIQKDPFDLYSLHGQAFAAVYGDDLLVVSKSQSRVERAREVLEGKNQNLTEGASFAAFPETPNSFFFLAVAEGFNQLAAIPPQAKVLQMAEGGRIILGERSDNLFLNFVLLSKTQEATTQIQQVIQGMVALVSLSQTDNKDLMDLAQSVKVSSDKNAVTLGVEYPVAKAIEKFSEMDHDSDRPKAQKPKRKKAKKPVANPDSLEEKAQPQEESKGKAGE